MIFNDYRATLIWTAVIIATVIFQWLVASGSKAGQKGAIPGKAPEELSHQNFVFRAWRTHQNSLENLSPMLGTVVLAIFAGVDPRWTASLTAVFAVARLAHMVLYYVIATNKNPSPRSYFFMVGFTANVVLLAMVIVKLF
ncbi:MAPEG family protein [Idiomarina seosinensis]|uniref:MAPEG family protein n=1 Tax=Idiomarina seosinensis TaxID=281739 RepID=UPI003850B397